MELNASRRDKEAVKYERRKARYAYARSLGYTRRALDRLSLEERRALLPEVMWRPERRQLIDPPEHLRQPLREMAKRNFTYLDFGRFLRLAGVRCGNDQVRAWARWAHEAEGRALTHIPCVVAGTVAKAWRPPAGAETYSDSVQSLDRLKPRQEAQARGLWS